MVTLSERFRSRFSHIRASFTRAAMPPEVDTEIIGGVADRVFAEVVPFVG
jgi:hypothetical protein